MMVSDPKVLLDCAGAGVMFHQYLQPIEEHSLQNRQSLNQFFVQTERRAFRMAELATGSSDVALDIVQDAMFALVKKYTHRPSDEWGPLFHRIMQSKIRDWYRRSSVRNRVLGWLHIEDEDQVDPIQSFPDRQSHNPEQHATQQDSMQQTMHVIGELPLRQQQCFLLRAWEGYSVRDTAEIMGCSEGSVKTHYSRAVKTLKVRLGETGLQESTDVS